MAPSPSPDEIPVYEDPDVRDRHYHEAEAAGEPYLAVERVEAGYAVTFDLMPAGAQLTAPAREALRDRLHEEVETVVGDAAAPETELSHTLGPALGSIAAFESATAAAAVAAALAPVLLAESNWETYRQPAADVDPSRND